MPTILYVQLVEEPVDRIAGKTFNAGYENRSIREIAETVKGVVEDGFPVKAPLPIVTTESDDIRSYVVSSDKIRRELGFVPSRTIGDAARQLCDAFAAGMVHDPLNNSRYYNISVMKEIGLK